MLQQCTFCLYRCDNAVSWWHVSRLYQSWVEGGMDPAPALLKREVGSAREIGQSVWPAGLLELTLRLTNGQAEPAGPRSRSVGRMAMQQQHVCITCGYNMIGECPDSCPFCGAGREAIVSSEVCSRRYAFARRPHYPAQCTGIITDRIITRLNSVPKLGIQHAAYRSRPAPRCIGSIACHRSIERPCRAPTSSASPKVPIFSARRINTASALTGAG